MIRFLILQLLLLTIAFAGEEKEFSPTQKFISVINIRQEKFEAFRKKIFEESICPGSDYNCVLKELKSWGIQSSGDVSNGVSLFSFMAKKKFQRGDCKEICRMNIYAEYSVAVVDFLKTFDRKKIFVNLLPAEHRETKYLIINEELRFFDQLTKLHEKTLQHWKKIEVTKIFRPELAKRMQGLKAELDLLKPSVLLQGSYLSSLSEKDDTLKLAEGLGMKSERERLKRKELVSLFRSEIK
jgi:hypothetical protein